MNGNRIRLRITAALLAALLLALTCACSDAGGRTDRYDGFAVTTEKRREETPAPENTAATDTRSAQAPQTETYVVNLHTMRFHYPLCSAAETMKESNRWETDNTREQLIEMGYTPCKQCSP